MDFVVPKIATSPSSPRRCPNPFGPKLSPVTTSKLFRTSAFHKLPPVPQFPPERVRHCSVIHLQLPVHQDLNFDDGAVSKTGKIRQSKGMGERVLPVYDLT